jgi:putative transposase
MSGFALRANQTFDWAGARFRIDRIQANGEVVLERIDDGCLQIASREKLLTEFSAGRIQAKDYVKLVNPRRTLQFSRPIQELPANILVDVERRMAYVRALLDTGSPMFTKTYCQPLIQRAAEAMSDPNPPSISTLYRWYLRYRATKDIRSLVPRYDRRGSHAIRVSEDVLALLSQATEEAFKASPRATGDDVFIRLKGKIDHENRSRIGKGALPLPCRRTVYRLLKKIEFYDQLVLREDRSAADRRCRINRKGVVTHNILERVEADHTPLDLFLIDDRTWLPLGKPVLTMLIDHYSRMPIGYYLSFSGTSAAAVMGAFRHAVLPKTSARVALENLPVHHSWPCFGIPFVLVVDNGLEFHGIDLESVAYDLGMRIQYCPKRTPRFKGVIERYLKTINYFFAHQLPGTAMAKLAERGDYDSEKHALLTMAEFLQILEKWILDVYAQTIHRSIKVTPWSKWQEGLMRVEPVMPDSVASLKQRIGLIAERSVRRDGIWLNNLNYTGEELGTVLRRFGEGVQVRVLYDPEDLGKIQVWAPDQQEPLEVQAADFEYASGLNKFQHELICQQIRDNGAATEDRNARDLAKYEIACKVEELMVSRKLKNRRRSAVARGITSANATKPPAKKQEVSNQAVPPAARLKTSKALGKPEALMPAPLPSFQLKARGGQHG